MEIKKEVNLCNIRKCPLWPYRFGKNPFRKHGSGRKFTEEEIRKNTEILRKYRENKKNAV